MSQPLTFGPRIDALLDRLYTKSTGQTEETMAFFSARAKEPAFAWNRFDSRTHEFLRDKLVALDRDKADFCYQVCRALHARTVVEVGTSFGVSTIFLAAAVRDNLQHDGGAGIVIG